MVDADVRAVPGAQEQDVPAIALRNLSKSFGGVHALQGVSLTIRPREVHGLLGQNGSGKSTLIKILAGYHAPEPGATLEVHGERVRLPLQPGQFRDLGMSFVHQDLALIPSLSVTENLRLGELAAARRWHISWDRERRRPAAIHVSAHQAKWGEEMEDELSQAADEQQPAERGFTDDRRFDP